MSMPKKRSAIRETVELGMLKAIFAVLGSFSLRRSMDFGKRFALFAAKLFPKLTKTAYRNLEIAYPDMPYEDREKIVRGTFESLGRHLGFVSHFNKFSPEKLREVVELEGEDENLKPLVESKRGIIFFTGHFGSWEVFNLVPPAFGYDINILVRRIDNPAVENFVESLRTRFGSVTVDKRRAARKLYKLLESGKIIGILADLNVQQKEGVFVDFFNKTASTSTTIAKLALKTGAGIVPAFAVWNDEKEKYTVYLDKPILPDGYRDNENAVTEITQEITALVEKYVRRYPEQWLWIHKRWNTRPNGEPELY